MQQRIRLAPARRVSVSRAAALVGMAVALGGLVATAARAQGQAPAAMSATANPTADMFVKADANRDGKLSRDEVKSLPAIAEKFDMLDKDKDGALSAEEFASGAAVR